MPLSLYPGPKRVFIRLSSLFFLFLTPMTQAPTATKTTPGADAIVGTWVSQAQDSKTEIVRVGDAYAGKLLAGWGYKLYEADGKTLRRDVKNPAANLRDRTLLGMVILSGLRYEDGEYKGGRLYDARLGKTFRCDLKLNANTLEMRIYWGFPLFGTTKKWTRTEN